MIDLSVVVTVLGYDPMPVTINTCGGCGYGGVGSTAVDHRFEFLENLVTKSLKVMESSIMHKNPQIIKGKSQDAVTH